MDSERLSKWSSIAEITSSVAVVITLVFLVVEFRQNNDLIEQNNRAIRDAAIASLDEGVLAVMGLLAESRENAVLFDRGVREFESLNTEEVVHFRTLFNAVFLRMDVSWYAYRNGLLPEELWRREEGLVRRLVNSPGGRAVWANTNISREFADFIRAELVEAP